MDNLDKRLSDLEARMKAEKNMERGMKKGSELSSLASVGSAQGKMKRPKELGDLGTPTRTRKPLDLPVSIIQQPKQIDSLEIENKMKDIMRVNGILNINNRRYQTEMNDLEHLGELGNGTCGQVVKMLHSPSQSVIAVKQMRRSGNSEENKRIIMDLDVVLKSHDCPTIVRCLGCFITESDVWICMELMATCFDRLLKRLHVSVPENICGKITLSTVRALHYLKETHGVIHRDVKPSNILIDEKGNIKLCDFGISGRLVDSKARTKNAGCAAYMAPERIEPPDPRKPDYDIRADVWSLGITLVELATGEFPYKDCKCDFEVLSRVLNDDPPALPKDQIRFSAEFQNFVSSCLTKDYLHRPKYRKLLEHPFLRRYEHTYVDVASWYRKVIDSCGVSSPALSIRNPSNGKSSVVGSRTNVSLSSPQPFRRRNRTPDVVDREASSSNSLQKKYHQQSYYRSASVSPNRYHVSSTSDVRPAEKMKAAKNSIGNFLKNIGVVTTTTPASPPPPPRFNRNIESPSLMRRVSELTNNNQSNFQSNQSNHFSNLNNHSNNLPLNTNPFVQFQPQPSSNPFNTHNIQSRFLHQNSNPHSNTNSYKHSPSPLRRNPDSSPCLSRRHNISPSPPMPPPRRLSECNSMPHPNLSRPKYSYTPEPTRRINSDL